MGGKTALKFKKLKGFVEFLWIMEVELMRKEYIALVAAIVAGVLMAIVGFFVGNNMSKDKVVPPAEEVREEKVETLESAPISIEEDEASVSPAEIEAGVAEVMEDSEVLDVAEDPEALAEDLSEYVYDDDPYGMYLVSEEWASENGGLFVCRNNKLYAITNLVPRSTAEPYGVGYSMGSDSVEIMYLYLHDDKKGIDGKVPTEINNAIISSGDFPILKVGRGEEIVEYSNYPQSSLSLTKTDMVGYTIEAANFTGNRYEPVTDHVLLLDQPPRSDIGVFDTNENAVADVRDLNSGETYIYEWYEGTQYHELRLPANCRCYIAPSKDATPDYEFSPELTKSGYATYDFSGVEPGVYSIGSSSVFEITD